MSASPSQALGQKINKVVAELCQEEKRHEVWDSADLVFLVTGVVANAALIWLFVKERKSFSASKVLGVNIIVMDFISLSISPVSLIHQLYSVKTNHSDLNSSDAMDTARDAFSMFNLIGCPLLLTCMCIERYLAVMRPVLYMRARKWEYRMAACAVVWAITLAFCVASVLADDVMVLLMCVFIIISFLFMVMLACLGCVLQALLQQSPAHSAHGNRRRSESPQKRQAVVNVLIVVVPSVVAYLPVLVLPPPVLFAYYHHLILNSKMCALLEVSHFFPILGVLIGPLFYFSKAKQMCCLPGTGKTTHTEM